MHVTRHRRSDYEDSCKFLQNQGLLPKGAIPPMPHRRPMYDDEALRVSFFRTFVRDCDLENLTIPRTYFARSEVGPVSFKNTDLSESTLCWNDFKEVNFTDADLSRSDLRGSIFDKVVFVRASLRSADLRHSSFKACDFSNADMSDAKVTCIQGKSLILSEKQRQEIDWQDSNGKEPPGG